MGIEESAPAIKVGGNCFRQFLLFCIPEKFRGEGVEVGPNQ